MNSTSVFCVIIGLLLLCSESLCYDCCTTSQSDKNSLKVLCRSITTLTALRCLTVYLANLSSINKSLDIQISNCKSSLFPDNYFQNYRMAGLKMDKCCLTNIPSRIYGLSCSTMTNAMMLRQNDISTIDPVAFNYCPEITSLDLSNNRLSSINNGDFKNLKSLATLILSHNFIQRVEGFNISSTIAQMYLDCNVISYISPTAFEGMTAMKMLFLNNNSLTTLTEGVFNYFQLTNLSLDGNHFVCNCSLLWLQNWLQARPFLQTGAQCETPVVGPVESTPFCITTTAAPKTSTSHSTLTSSTLLTATSTGLTSLATQSTSDAPITSTTSLSSSSSFLTFSSFIYPSTSTIRKSSSDGPTTTTPSVSTSSFSSPPAIPSTLSSSSLVPTSQKSVFSTIFTTVSTPSDANGGSTQIDDDGGGSDKIIVSNFSVSSDLILTWSTNESKVMILYGPINDTCSNASIYNIFGNMAAGVRAIVIANQTDYQIQEDDDDLENNHMLLICITNAQSDINVNNLYCNTSCQTSHSTLPTVNPTSSPQATISMSIAIGLICLVIFICLIIITALLCILRCTSKKKKGKVNILSSRNRPLPSRPPNESTQANKFPSERNGLPNPMYNQGNVIGDNRSYLYLEPSIPEECDIDEPINFDTYEKISIKESDIKESKDLTTPVSNDSPSDAF